MSLDLRISAPLALAVHLAACTPVSLDPIPGDDSSSGAFDPSTTSGGDSSSGELEPTGEPDPRTTTGDDDETTGAPAFECGDEIVAPDPALMQDLRDQLFLPEGPITAELAQGLKLVFVSAEVEQLDGLQCFPALTLVQLEPTSPVSDLGPLAALKQLEAVIVSVSQVHDLSPLAGLPQLASVSAASTAVTDLSPLAAAPNLEVLIVSHSAVHSFAPLAGHPKLVQIEANALQGKLDPAGLASLPALARLELDANQLDSLDFLVGAPSLRFFSAMETGVTDLTPLAGVKTLNDLRLSVNAITDVSPLAGLPELEFLGIDDNPLIGGLAGLAGATALQSISAHNTGLDEIPDLAPAPIELLILTGNHIVDVSPLLAYPDLELIALDDNQITSLAPIADPPWTTGQIGFPNNPLDAESLDVVIPGLCAAGFTVIWSPNDTCGL